MKRLLLMVTFTTILASHAEAQQVPDPRVADLLQAGKIRVGMHSVMYTRDSRTGELKAASTGIILLDIARTLGARIGVKVLPVGHPTIPEMLTCLTAGACSCALDMRTRLPQCALCFWRIPQGFPARGCWRTTTAPTSSAWWCPRVKPSD